LSESGYLVCNDCRVYIWLGKAVKDEDSRVVYFKVGAAEPNWQQPGLTRAVWKFLADHVGHHLESAREYSDRYDEMVVDDPPDGSYVEIGDLSTNGPTFEKYLEGWPNSA
jgi:hypothetical protein